MNIALVYDRVNKIGGAERVLCALHEIWPDAPLYTAVYNKDTAPWADSFDVRLSFLQNFPLAKTKHELYPWLTPLAFESFNFDSYDVVISITSAEAKGIITKPQTLHICYCLTPTRYLWSGYNEYFKDPIKKFLTKPVINYLKSWDKTAAQRPDIYIAISKEVQKRINTYYDRKSEVIYPPVSANVILSEVKDPARPTKTRGDSSLSVQNDNAVRGKYFLIVSRLVPYKKIDIAVRAFNSLGWPLVIVGDGSERKKLEAVAKKNITFTGLISDEKLTNLYLNCQALVFPGVEDFGITPLEAQAAGKPVIAYGKGGARETIIEGKTGLFFNTITEEALTEALRSFHHESFKREDCQENAKKFEKGIFKEKIKNKVESYYQEANNKTL